MKQEDIIKAITTENGIDKNILNEITISNKDFFDRCSYCIIIARGRAFEIQDKKERDKMLDIINKNEDMIFMLNIFDFLIRISKKHNSSVIKELTYIKQTAFSIINEHKYYKFLYISVSLLIIIMLIYIKNLIGFIPKIFAYCFTILLLSIAYLYRKSNKKIDINIKTIDILCKIEKEILN